MPNWCSTSLEIETGTEMLAKKVSDKIESWCHECGVENGFGDSWLGNIAVNSNAFPKYSDVSCRGTLEDVWAEGTKVHCIVYSAWVSRCFFIVRAGTTVLWYTIPIRKQEKGCGDGDEFCGRTR